MKGDDTVVEHLNRGLRSGLTAVSQCWLHYRMLDNWDCNNLAKQRKKESIEEMVHADRFVDRILFLDGHPNLQVSTRSASARTSMR
jgi:bacterioferritin